MNESGFSVEAGSVGFDVVKNKVAARAEMISQMFDGCQRIRQVFQDGDDEDNVVGCQRRELARININRFNTEGFQLPLGIMKSKAGNVGDGEIKPIRFIVDKRDG